MDVKDYNNDDKIVPSVQHDEKYQFHMFNGIWMTNTFGFLVYFIFHV